MARSAGSSPKRRTDAKKMHTALASWARLGRSFPAWVPIYPQTLLARPERLWPRIALPHVDAERRREAVNRGTPNAVCQPRGRGDAWIFIQLAFTLWRC